MRHTFLIEVTLIFPNTPNQHALNKCPVFTKSQVFLVLTLVSSAIQGQSLSNCLPFICELSSIQKLLLKTNNNGLICKTLKSQKKVNLVKAVKYHGENSD